jgi:hypothetical protein
MEGRDGARLGRDRQRFSARPHFGEGQPKDLDGVLSQRAQIDHEHVVAVTEHLERHIVP